MKRENIKVIRQLLKLFCLVYFTLQLYSCSPTKSISIPEEKEISVWMAETKVPTVGICIIEDGKVKKANVYGSIRYHSPAPVNTIFNIASLSKLLLSTVTLKLIDKGQWQLDEPLYHYWTDPDVENDPRNKKITTRLVLCHKTGLPNWRGHEPDGKLNFAFEPGTDWKYSGEGYEYLRQAIEHKFHLPMEMLVDSLVLKPLEMNDTRYYWDEKMDTTLYADRYHEDGSAFEMEKWYEANASNLVLTTVTDYGKFGAFVINGMNIDKQLQREMISTQAVLKNGKEFGLGWVLLKNLSDGEYAIVHTGSNAGINTVILLLPKSKRGIVVFTNGDKGRELFGKIIENSLEQGKEILQRME